jgi:1,4-alpha-glucan branching enzyme
VLAFIRRDRKGEIVACVLNFTPVPRHDYRIGVPCGGTWHEILNSDAQCYGGSGVGNGGTVQADDIPAHGRSTSLRLVLPPLGALLLRPDREPT